MARVLLMSCVGAFRSFGLSEARCGGRLGLGFGGVMSEVVVVIGAEECRDPSGLMKALDAFAKWAAESGLTGPSGDAPDFMMKSEFAGGEMRRKLVFQDRQHAARFLVFWRAERQRNRAPETTLGRV